MGTTIAQITANDVDTAPALTYGFAEASQRSELTSMFAINRFNGKIILKKPLDYELKQMYKLRIKASDKNHTAETTVVIKVLDANDHAPSFDRPVYQAVLSGKFQAACLTFFTLKCIFILLVAQKSTSSLVEILKLNATDGDTGKNGEIVYTIVEPKRGFSIGQTDGILKVNVSQIEQHSDVDLLIAGSDRGSPPLKSVTAVKVHILSTNNDEGSYFQNQYRTKIREDSIVGSTVIRLAMSRDFGSHGYSATIIEGDPDHMFGIAYPNLDIILMKPLNREIITEEYRLQLLISERAALSNLYQNTTVNVYIFVEDFNNHAPVFQPGNYDIVISESMPVKQSVGKMLAIDPDMPNTVNSEVIYSIASGNDDQAFTIDLISGVITVHKKLDYDLGKKRYVLVIQACDSTSIPLCSIQQLSINLTDANDNTPKFSLPEYFALIGENEPAGYSIFTVKAIDLDAGEYGILNYSLSALNGFSEIDESWKSFRIDSKTGTIYSNVVFDYEYKSHYNMLVHAIDSGGKDATSKLHILIESRDEFVPQFLEKDYSFSLKPFNGKQFPVDHIVGYIRATDQDQGIDGRVLYQLTTNNPYFKINYTTGAISTKRKIDTVLTSKDVSLVVTASSGRQGSLTNMTVVEILIDSSGIVAVSNENLSNEADVSEVGSWVIGLLITLIIFLTIFATAFFFIHWRKRGLKHVSKPRLNSENNTVNTNSYVDPSTFDTIPIRGSDVAQSSSSGFAPPRYDEIPPYGLHTGGSSNSGAATTSDLSTSDQSGSSGRGSAEDDGEDEEIRMINEGPLQRDSLQNNGRLSDVSVHNSNREYLTRLAVADSLIKNNRSSSSRRGPLGSDRTLECKHHHPMHYQIDDDENDGADLTNLIYAKLNDMSPGSVVGNRDDLASTGSIKQAVEHMIMTGFQQVPQMVIPQGPGSFRGGCNSHSSVMHGDEDLTSNYNWDYLLDWGPAYQPLAHVFNEIARLKDDSMSVSGQSQASSIRSRNSLHHTIKHIPPPLITNVAPRLITHTAPVISSRSSNNSGRYSHSNTNISCSNNMMSRQNHYNFSTPSPMPPSFTHNLLPNLDNNSPSPSMVDQNTPMMMKK